MPQIKKKVSRLDQMAKAQGFPSYAAMKAWNAKYRAPQTTTTPKPKARNFLQSLTDVIPIQFASRRVTAALKGAQRK